MSFQKHPSTELVDLFTSKPYQGQSPQDARIIFLSSDANYSEQVSEYPFFSFILDYQKDGVAFWEKYGCHHPFLLDNYPADGRTGGRRFHKQFCKLGFNHTHAKHISFIELLDVPTLGIKSKGYALFYSLVNPDHLRLIDDIVKSDSKKLILVPDGVLQDMIKLKKQYNVFDWLNYKSSQRSFSTHISSNKVQRINHFSSSQANEQLNQVRKMIDEWLKN